MGRKFFPLIYEPLTLLSKEIKSELRTRYALNAVLMFGIVTLAVVSITVGQYSLNSKILASLFWIVLFFSSMSGLAHVFVKEEEKKTSDLLKLVAKPSTVFLGKFFFNLVFFFFLEVVIVPLFILLLGLEIQNPLFFFCVLILSTLGLVSATTIIGAMVSKARVKGALFAVLSFPILLPLLITAIDGTYLSIQKTGISYNADNLRFLFSYFVVMLVLSFLLFEFVWKE